MQKPEETVGQFIGELCKLSEYCEFGGTLDDMLRLVCGCKDSRLQCKLFAESDLTFERAFKLAVPPGLYETWRSFPLLCLVHS